MQTLFVKQPGGGTKPVQIIRAYLNNGAAGIYLHANGRYAYKSGQPLQNEAELNIIPEPQRTIAKRWWQRIGRAESEAYYQQLDQTAKQKAGDFQMELEDTAELDMVMYTRRPTGKKGAVTAPHTWPEWFAKRPDWWGQARNIRFTDYEYEIEDLSDEPAAGKETSADDDSITGAGAAPPAG